MDSFNTKTFGIQLRRMYLYSVTTSYSYASAVLFWRKSQKYQLTPSSTALDGTRSTRSCPKSQTVALGLPHANEDDPPDVAQEVGVFTGSCR